MFAEIYTLKKNGSKQYQKRVPFRELELRWRMLRERPCVPTLWYACAIRPDITGRDDVATKKYKSTCGEENGSFFCSIGALCVLRLFYGGLSHYIIIMATGKHESDK